MKPRLPRFSQRDKLNAATLNRLVDAINARSGVRGDGKHILVSEVGEGWLLKFAGKAGGGTPAPTARTTILTRVKSISNDYLVCRTWDGTTEGDTDLYVAKPYKLRHVAANYGLAPGGITTIGPQIIRINSVTPARNWYVTPYYLVNDPLWVDIVSWTGLTVVIPGLGTTVFTYLDANKDARAWAQEA